MRVAKGLISIQFIFILGVVGGRKLGDFLIGNGHTMLTPFSGLHCFIPSCKSTGICWCSVQCCVQLWKEAVCLSKGQSKDMDSVASCLLPGMELENKYILISNFCVVLFFFSFKIRKITRITFKKMNLLTVGLLACKC